MAARPVPLCSRVRIDADGDHAEKALAGVVLVQWGQADEEARLVQVAAQDVVLVVARALACRCWPA